MGKESPESDAVAIEKERQKTKRLIIRLTFGILILGIGGLLIYKAGKGSLELTSEGGFKLTLEKPILEQVSQKTASYTVNNKTVSFTTGRVEPAVIKQVEENYNETILPTKFAGENLINKELGYLLTAKNPQKWQVNYNSAGLSNPLIPVNTIYLQDGTHLNINFQELLQKSNIRDYTEQQLQLMLQNGLIAQLPKVVYDDNSQTAFLYYVNPVTGGETYQKIILNRNKAFAATANYNPYINSEVIRDLIEMVGTFTLIES